MTPVYAFPVLDDDALSKIVKINREGDLPGYQTYVARGLYEVDGGAAERVPVVPTAPIRSTGRRREPGISSPVNDRTVAPPSRSDSSISAIVGTASLLRLPCR